MKHILSCVALLFPSLVHAQGFSPEEAVKRMKVPDGFTVKLVACEPMIRQPLSIDFDERGRMWVLQYLQYPNPAGLKALKQDQYLRTIWDRVPEPPPKGPRGLDRITICYDPDENGRYRKSKDFVKDLNLASGFCLGNGGVYVLQSPYLLFYADKNRDDIPDGDPEVLLKGFGFNDTHSVANSLQFGPDGWLYGAAGSTSTSKIDDPSGKCKTPIEFQQGIWRYHPKTKQFELFSEGGGNTFGLDFDKHGQAIAGTNWGSYAMLHQMQGAYYIKGFSKHGPLHNPCAYGYFDHVPYENFKGGHVTCGGIIYQGDTYPPEYRDQYIAGNLLSNAVYWHKMTPRGSSFTAKHGGDFLIANDTWFRPVDCFQGPDGSVYVADWYDKRAAHLDPIDNWDKTNGRIYKVEYKGTKPILEMDLAKLKGPELVEMLRHPNKWYRNEARRLMAEKPHLVDQTTFNRLSLFLDESGDNALEALWAFYVSETLTPVQVDVALSHPNEHVRSWMVRLLGDRGAVNSEQFKKLTQLARGDSSPIVRAQLACTAKRLPGKQAIPILYELVLGSSADRQIPLLIWWAIEHHAVAHGPEIIDWLAHRADATMMRDVILERLARRFIAEGTPGCYGSAAALYRMVLEDAHALIVLRGMNQALQGNRLEQVPDILMKTLRDRAFDPEKHQEYQQVLLRLGDSKTYQDVLKAAGDANLQDAIRLKKFELLAEMRKPDALPLFLDVFQNGKTETIRLGALNALQGYADPKAGEIVLQFFPKLTGNLRAKAQAFLVNRQATALAFLQLVEKGTVAANDVSVDQLRPVLQFNDPAIVKIVEKHWGKIGAATAGEKQARIAWLRVELGRGTGNVAEGKALFTKHCATCHTMFGEGGKIGPDLTTSDRKNRDYLLTHIVDPSLYIRPEFVSYNLTALDGRKLSGLVSATESNEGSVTLVNVVDNKPVKTIVLRKDIDEMLPSATSLMPDKLLDTLQYQEVRDLFVFLQSEPKSAPKDGANAKPKEAPRTKPKDKLKVLLISGSLEYKSDESLAAFQKYLEANFPVECKRAFRKADDDLPGLEALETCDAAIFFTRRLTIKGEQLDRVKKYAMSGKPIVGIRTASHGFQNWLAMDKEVLGGNYQNHYGADQKCEVSITPSAKDHPILKGVKPFESHGGLYKNPNINKDVALLLTGSIPKNSEPIAWVREHNGGRVFYTSLGHPDDFKNENFTRMMVNAIFWTAKREIPANR